MRSPTRQARLLVTRLEDRTTPAIIPVSTLADTGTGSLREAIALANAASDADTIVFTGAAVGGTINLVMFDNRGASTTDDPQPVGPTAFIIVSPITIQGTGESITRAVIAMPFRLFQVTAAGNLTLRNLTL